MEGHKRLKLEGEGGGDLEKGYALASGSSSSESTHSIQRLREDTMISEDGSEEDHHQHQYGKGGSDAVDEGRHEGGEEGHAILGNSSSGVRKRLASKEVPLMRRPLGVAESEALGGLWVRQEHAATEWLSLFYDLVVVAVLTTFSKAHELQTPRAIPGYLSYYIILAWCWSSQTHYDIRYQAEDAYHRLLKALQIACFVYMGAASGGWSPGYIQYPGTITDRTVSVDEATKRRISHDSFEVVVIAFLISRFLLCTQYCITTILGKKAGRKIRKTIIQAATLAVSGVLSIVAVLIPAKSHGMVIAKIFLFYLGIGLEVSVVWFTLHDRTFGHISTERIAERYGAFTLIILGEGFLSMVKAFSAAFSSLSQTSRATYAQVFIVIMIMYLLYLFLFARFSKESAVNNRRAVLWEILHFPLLFGLLLLLAAMVNVVVTISYTHGMGHIVDIVNSTQIGLYNNLPLSSETLYDGEYYIDRLNIYPDYNVEYDLLRSIANSTNPEDDYMIMEFQYFGQVAFAAAYSYGIEIEPEDQDRLENLLSMNTSYIPDEKLRNETVYEAGDIVIELIQDPLNRALSGVLWLFPTAGGVLILASVRSLLWYQYSGLAHWAISGTQIIVGLGLGLLGLLDIGNHHVDLSGEEDLTFGTTKMYDLVDNEWALGIVAIAYFVAYFGPVIFLGWWNRKRGGVWAMDEERERGEKGRVEVHKMVELGH